MNRQLLTEYIPFKVSPTLIQESMGKNNGKLIVSGLLQSANKLNQNGRIYPENILKRECSKYLKHIEENRALGELDHPDSPVVNLQNTSHIIRRLWWNGNNVMGEIEVLPTPSGRILKSLFEAGVNLGISSRGMGSTMQDESANADIVADDFELIGWDFVSNPSTLGANFKLNESKDMSFGRIIGSKNKPEEKDINVLISENVRDIIEIYNLMK